MQAQAFQTWQIGEIVGDQYRIAEMLGRGQHAITYRVEHLAWQQDVCLKVWVSTHWGKAELERMVQQWQQLPLHPLLASCYYWRRDLGMPLLVTDYVAGTPLEDWLHRSQLRFQNPQTILKRLLDIAIQTAWGLAVAHQHQVVHGNWKLSNVMMTVSGTVRLTDWFAPPQQDIAADRDAWLAMLFTLGTTVTAWPDAILAQLHQWQGNVPGLGSCAEKLMQLYRDELDRPYPRPNLMNHADMPGKLNNQALARLDLGDESGALALWDAARNYYTQHPETVYNAGLWQWRQRHIHPDQLLYHLRALPTDTVPWEGFILLEAGNPTDAIATLTPWRPPLGHVPLAVERARYQAEQQVNRQACRPIVGNQAATIGAIAYSPDGRYCAWGDATGGLMVWDLHLSEGHRLSGHHRAAIAMVYLTADNCYLVSVAYPEAEADATLKLWSCRTGKCLATFPHLQTWHQETLRSDATQLPTRWSADGRFALHQSTQLLTLTEKATGQILVAMTPTGQLVQRVKSAIAPLPAAPYGLGRTEDTAMLWNLHTHEIVMQQPISAETVAIAPLNAQDYLTVTRNGHLQQWSWATESPLARWSIPVQEVTGLQVSESGSVVLIQGNPLMLWSLVTGQGMQTLTPPQPQVQSALSPQGQAVVFGDRAVYLWQVQTDAIAYRAPWQLSRVEMSTAVTGDLNPQYLHEAEQAWQAGNISQTHSALQQLRESWDFSLHPRAFALWAALYRSLIRQDCQGAWLVQTSTAHSNRINQANFQRDERLITCSGNGTLKQWHLQPERVLGTVLLQVRGWLNGFAISPDGQWLVTASQRDGLQQWFRDTGKLHKTLSSPRDIPLTRLAWTPDGEYLVGGSETGELQLWALQAGKCLRTWQAHAHAIAALALSPDGQTVVTADRTHVWKLWDLATGSCQQMVTSAQTEILAVAYSAEGQYVATAGADQTVMLWSAATGRRLRVLRGHQDSVTAVCFLRDSRHLFSGSADGQAKLWQVDSGHCLQTLAGTGEAIATVAVSGNGQYAAVGTVQGTLQWWALDWQLAAPPPTDCRCPEAVEPYLSAFLTRQTPRRAIAQEVNPRNVSLPQRLREFPLTVMALWVTLLWLGIATGLEVFRYSPEPWHTLPAALGAAGLMAGYFTGRQWGNPTVQLGALFGLTVLSLVGLVDLTQQWYTLTAVLWGAIAVLLSAGPVLGLWHSAPATRPPGLRTTQSLTHYWGRGGTVLILTAALLLAAGFEALLQLTMLPIGAIACVPMLLFAVSRIVQGGWGQVRLWELLRGVGIWSLILATSFKWFVPSQLGAIPDRACETFPGLTEYLERGGTPNAGPPFTRHSGVLLQCALRSPNPLLLTTLIQHGAQLNRLDVNGEGLLHQAVAQNNRTAVEDLLRAGADVNLRDRAGRTPLHYANTVVLIDRLVAAKANINIIAPRDGTPLHRAVSQGEVAIAQALLRHGANPNLSCRDCAEYAPIYSAIHQESWELLRLLLAQPDLDLTVRDRDEHTPLEYAQSHGKRPAINLIAPIVETNF